MEKAEVFQELEDKLGGDAGTGLLDLFTQNHIWWPAVVRWHGLEEDPINALTAAQKWYTLRKEERVLIRSNWDGADVLARARMRP